MKYSPTLFLTGATGFIGGAVAARLIRTPKWANCLFLVRASTPEGGVSRLAHVLKSHDVTDELLEKIRPEQIICGSLTDVSSWENDPRLLSVVDVISSAAVASFGNHPSIWPTNVDGVMAMARRFNEIGKLRRFLHLGTAMACGRQAPIPVPEGYDAGADTDPFLQYTESKYEIERRLRAEFPAWPLVVARPSIVVGHTRLGCQPSGSIYWVFRIARALKCFTSDLNQRVDVIPVDYCAKVIHHLIEKPTLKYTDYHISAGPQRACTFEEIDAAIATAIGEMPMGTSYKVKTFEEIAEMQHRFKDLLGPCNRRIVLRAIRSYGSFAFMGMLFQNDRLIEEGLDLPPPLTSYAGLCQKTSHNQLISEQMKFDYK
ncbi:SDR family oxidoreductase [Limnobacter litoralis]|uniref:Thioester reductase (TE) domain-containing protein n=1 Tax=Limnobacter litoralis TaxID=481366 RepID=A0ABQ5YRA7_9BURK|nr:SDR family oxidoreductase [Limnobacter litoralis]GLR27129.1 hypothetical protein GCM10007875_22200 [Limnobacter litoralis]